MPFIARILLLALALPFVLAHGGSGGGDDDCPDGQFRWKTKDMCLPNGGTPNPSKPPPNTDCPSQWSWLPVKGCCAPHNPPDNQPPPQCGNNWKWNTGSLCCKPPSTPPTPNPPAPSRNPSNPYRGGDNDNDNHGNGHNHKRVNVEKRQYRSRNVTPCPKGLSACPVASLIGGDYECVDTLLDLDNCGGCSALGEGENCNAIPGVWNVGCEQSACTIYTCAEGYVLSKDGKTCNSSR